jgi:hypothetical protein
VGHCVPGKTTVKKQNLWRGTVYRLLAKRERIRQKRLSLLVTREWLLHLKHRREIEAVRMYHRVREAVGCFEKLSRCR